MDWRTEIIELHGFFERYFIGTEDSIARFENALADDFSMVDPSGNDYDRAAVLDVVRDGHGHTSSLVITTSDHRLLATHEETIVAQYIETHELAERTNRRKTTAVFVADRTTPNGLAWLRVHETWLEADD